MDLFLDLFLDQFLDQFFGPFFGTISLGGGRPLELGEGWDAVYQNSGKADRQTVVNEGGVEDELSVRKEGCRMGG